MFVGYKRRAKGYQKREIAPYVSINRRGEIVLNRAALAFIENAINVNLLYDADTNRLGIQPCDRGGWDLKVFHARRYGRGGRLRIISAGRLLKQFGITITETLVFRDLKTDKDGLLILDLRTHKEVLRNEARDRNYRANIRATLD